MKNHEQGGSEPEHREDPGAAPVNSIVDAVPAAEHQRFAKTILIVEDDEDTRTIYGDAPKERGYRVLVATQDAEGVHLTRRHHPDLILLDIRMPVMDGWGTAWYLKQDPETQHIPICAISAYTPDEEERDLIQRMQFDCWLMKPIDPRDVVAEIEARIGPPDLTDSHPILPPSV